MLQTHGLQRADTNLVTELNDKYLSKGKFYGKHWFLIPLYRLTLQRSGKLRWEQGEAGGDQSPGPCETTEGLAPGTSPSRSPHLKLGARFWVGCVDLFSEAVGFL